MNQNNRSWNNGLLIWGVVILVIVPLLWQRDAEFSGADGQVEAVIQEVNPAYQPWISPLLEPASGEIESLLFAVQAGLGAGVLGYILGFYRGRRERDRSNDSMKE